MSIVWDYVADSEGGSQNRSVRRPMGAEERRWWSSFVRQELVASTVDLLREPAHYGVVIRGVRGVGKSTLAKAVESSLNQSMHIVRLCGAGPEGAVAYGAWSLYLVRMDTSLASSPFSVIQEMAELVRTDAQGLPVLVVIEDVPSLDTSSLAVIMHLVLSGTAKVMVTVRTTSDLPEDLIWLLKDHLLANVVLENFTRDEVRSLFSQALGGSVATSVVEFLYAACQGNPLVLHALVHEEITKNNITQRNSTWVLNRDLHVAPSSLLEELVESRLARESGPVRRAIEKMALMRRAPLAIVIDILGPEAVAELEDRGYLAIEAGSKNYTSLAEPHIGETIRTALGREEKAGLFQEMESVVARQPSSLSGQELMIYAAWAHDSAIPLDPPVALAAAQMAVAHFDPMLALKCTTPHLQDTQLRPQVAMVRSMAYAVMADYPKAMAELFASKELAESRLEGLGLAEWLRRYCGALLWVDGGPEQIPGLLDAAKSRMAAVAGPQRERMEATLDLARYEYQVHTGRFAQAIPGLEAGYKNGSDIAHRHACGRLLILAWAVSGREVDAVALAQSLGRERDAEQKGPDRFDLSDQGFVLASTWAGQWKENANRGNELLATMRLSSQFQGGIAELGSGLAYAYAGKAAQAAEILVVAVAQLEIRDTYRCVKLAYAASAFAYAQLGDAAEAEQYLQSAKALASNTSWLNAAMTRFFLLMTELWLGNPGACDALIESAREDASAARYTLASISLFGATVAGRQQPLALLLDVSRRRQGPLAELAVMYAQAHLEKDPVQAMAAAELAHDLEVAVLEAQCTVSTLNFARSSGQGSLARAAELRLEKLTQSVPVLPIMPQITGEKLTQREQQIAKLASRGLGNREIADLMGVSARTVEGHLYQVFSKLGISSRRELM